MKKVTGIGGIFFKCPNPEQTRNWYRDHLGLETDAYGATFNFRLPDEPEKMGQLQWSTMGSDTKYFNPSKSDFMINYRVTDIEALVAELKANGVTVLDEIASYDYGKFVHILDNDGNKVELWEPVDE
ncbi:VOC family protein [bacterium]|nr:VOC family protein [bacterium]